MKRLEELLFTQGFGTRRVCRGLVQQGRVRVGSPPQPCLDPDALFEPQGFVFEVEGVPWTWHERAYLALHKPAGFECSQRPGAHPSIYTLLPAPLRQRGGGAAAGVQAVGRLDHDTTGLLLLSDDGPLIARISSPKFHWPKTYLAQVEGDATEEQLTRLRQGVELKDGTTRPAKAQKLVGAPDWLWPRTPPVRQRKTVADSWIELTITEGRNRQVRRMTAAVGLPTLRLVRMAMGDARLGDLAPGEWRPL